MSPVAIAVGHLGIVMVVLLFIKVKQKKIIAIIVSGIARFIGFFLMNLAVVIISLSLTQEILHGHNMAHYGTMHYHLTV
jgi:hypothetical protein